jgi:hypothetical protein
LTHKLDAFEIQWQLGTWGMHDGEEWEVTGNLLDILGHIKRKWGSTFSSATDRL